jgi:hypothetical protein
VIASANIGWFFDYAKHFQRNFAFYFEKVFSLLVFSVLKIEKNAIKMSLILK